MENIILILNDSIAAAGGDLEDVVQKALADGDITAEDIFNGDVFAFTRAGQVRITAEVG